MKIPDSLLPPLVLSLFRLADTAKRSFFQGINLPLRELDQFIAELFLIVRLHDMTSGGSRAIGMTGCPKGSDARSMHYEREALLSGV